MADQLSATFAALADPTRRAILERPAGGEASVTELAEPFAISLPGISKHLKVLERAGLIARGREAQWRPRRRRSARPSRPGTTPRGSAGPEPRTNSPNTWRGGEPCRSCGESVPWETLEEFMEAITRSVPGSKKMFWAGVITSAVPVLMLLMSAVMKFVKPAPVVEGFTQFGYNEGLILPLGIVELVCTAVYLVPRTAALGAILLTGYLGGATATNVRVGEQFIAPVLLGVLVWGGLYLRDARVRALIPLRS
jgi:DNA-binding transcriptional ArsR family regulator